MYHLQTCKSLDRACNDPRGILCAKFVEVYEVMLDAKYHRDRPSGFKQRFLSLHHRTIIELIRELLVIYILTKFGADLLIFADAGVYAKSNSKFSNSRADDSDHSVLTRSIIKLIRDLILTKFGADWLYL